MTAPRTIPFPKPIIDMGDSTRSRFETWINEQCEFLIQDHEEKVEQWAQEELAYRALADPPKTKPFVGACREVIPAIAMAVDPIHARLDTGIFKNDRIIRLKALDKSLQPQLNDLERFVEYYLRHYINLRQVASPRLIESAKHGHCVFRVEYEDDTAPVKTYMRDAQGGWQPAVRNLTKCRGPKITGIPIQNFIYPARYQHIQDAPVVFERVWVTQDEINTLVKRREIIIPDDSKLTETDGGERTELDRAQEDASQHHESRRTDGWFELFRFCCKFDIDENGYQESLLGIWDHNSQTLLQLRYNWYFHQRYPYVLIPYAITNGAIGGIGLCEMILPFQRSMTDWHQQLWNNAYLANSRVVVRKKDGVDTADAMAWYAGKEYFADDPDKDVKILAMSDVYRSGETMMQSLMGYVEKRTGVSDYLTGRESPIVGSRATATSTVALIQEGTKRVEETLENLRVGFAEMVEMCIYIWIQYGTNGLERAVFDDDTADKIRAFFDSATELDVGSSLSIELAATDASNNKAIQQQLQLALIQTFTVFYEKLMQAAQGAVQAAQISPPLAELVGQVMTDARKLYYDLATKYDVPSPEEYLPDLTAFLASIGASGAGNPTSFGRTPGAAEQPALGASPAPNGGRPGPVPAPGPGGNGAGGSVSSYT